MFATNDDRIAAEATVRAGARNGNWTAAGLALIVDRLDAMLAMFEDSGVFAEPTDEDSDR